MPSFLQSAKSTVLKQVRTSFASKGLVGKLIAKRMGRDEKDTRVEDALEDQNNVADQNTSTLERIESIVVNISDNIYNLTSVWSDYVVSLEETKRLRQEQQSRDAAAAEEAANEAASRIDAPNLAGTDTPATKDDKKGGMFSNLISAFGQTKSKFSGITKKLAVLLGGSAALILGANAIASDSSDSNQQTSDQSQPQVEVVSEQQEPPPLPSRDVPNVSQFVSAIKEYGGEQGAKDAQFMEKMFAGAQSGDIGSVFATMQEHAAANPQLTTTSIPSLSGDDPTSASEPAATPMPPPPVAASAPPSTPDTSTSTQPSADDPIKELEDRKAGLDKRLAQREKIKEIRKDEILKAWGTKDPERAKTLTDKVDKDFADYAADVEAAKAKIDASIASLKATGATNTPPSQGGTSSPSSSPGGDTGSVSVNPSSTAGAGAGASMVPSAASSTGADLNATSTAVSAAQEQAPLQPVVSTNIQNTSQNNSPPKNAIPSPIANRGSLDKNITFSSGS